MDKTVHISVSVNKFWFFHMKYSESWCITFLFGSVQKWISQISKDFKFFVKPKPKFQIHSYIRFLGLNCDDKMPTSDNRGPCAEVRNMSINIKAITLHSNLQKIKIKNFWPWIILGILPWLKLFKGLGPLKLSFIIRSVYSIKQMSQRSQPL